MYDDPAAPLAAGGTGSVLTHTGVGSIWPALAALALGTALPPLVPGERG